MATQKIDVRFPVFRERFCTLRGDMTQDEFAKKLGFSRPTIGLYESGSRIPDALALRTIAEKCDVSADWLVGLSSAKTANITTQGICKETGLSEEAVNELAKWNTIGSKVFSSTISLLLWDVLMAVDDKRESQRSILSLIYFYFFYSGTGSEKQIFANGTIRDLNSDGSMYYNALRLDDKAIENLVLMEIQQALIELKKSKEAPIVEWC